MVGPNLKEAARGCLTNLLGLIFIVLFLGIYLPGLQMFYRLTGRKMPLHGIFEQKLADCNTGIVDCEFECPKDGAIALLLGYPLPERADALLGRVEVKKAATGEEVYQFDFSGKTESANWLESLNLASHILTNDDAGNFHNIQPGYRYAVRVVFDSPLPEGSSLWLSWTGEDYQD